MDAANVGFAFIILVMLAFSFGKYMMIVHPKYMKKLAKYDLFELRDNLIRLTASGQIDEHDKTYQFVYRLITKLISKDSVVSYDGIISALSPSMNHFDAITGLEKARKHKNKILAKIADDLVGDLLEILADETRSLKLASMCLRVGVPGYRVTNKCRILLFKMSQDKGKAYELYRRLTEARQG